MTTRIAINGTRFLDIDGVIYPSVSNISNAFSPKIRNTSSGKRHTSPYGGTTSSSDRISNGGTKRYTASEPSIKAENTHRGIKLHQLIAHGSMKQPETQETEVDASMQPYLNHYKEFEDKNLTVHERETQVVFYDEGSGLRFAGAMDVLAEFRHKLCVADYKVSVRPKQLQHCFSFFLQIGGYAVAYEKATGVNIPTGSIINIHKYGVKTFHLSTVNFTYFKQSFIDAAIAYLRYQDALTLAKTSESSSPIIARSYFDWNSYVENSPLYIASKIH